MHDVFYFTDIHGDYDLYDSIIQWCIDTDPECSIIFGGDACDRGDYGYRIMQELLDICQVVYLKGNHEDMFVKAAREIIGFCAADDDIYNRFKSKDKEFARQLCLTCDRRVLPNLYLHLRNGGARTIQDWIVDGADEDFIEKIENLPLTFTYGNLDFCHSGYIYRVFKEVADAEHEGNFVWGDRAKKLLWDREAIPLGWETGRIAVFGHTPTPLLPRGIYGHDNQSSHAHPCVWKDHMGGENKRGGLKLDMDTGAVFTGRAFLLNCLTMTVYGFEKEVFENGCVIKNIDPYKII